MVQLNMMVRPLRPDDADIIRKLFLTALPLSSSHEAAAITACLPSPGCFGVIVSGAGGASAADAPHKRRIDEPRIERPRIDVGFILLYQIQDDSADILDIAVLPEYRGSGYGRMLLTAAQDYAVQRGIGTIILDVREGNIPALSLYDNAGFIRMGRRRDYYKTADGRADAIIMQKSLI